MSGSGCLGWKDFTKGFVSDPFVGMAMWNEYEEWYLKESCCASSSVAVPHTRLCLILVRYVYDLKLHLFNCIN